MTAICVVGLAMAIGALWLWGKLPARPIQRRLVAADRAPCHEPHAIELAAVEDAARWLARRLHSSPAQISSSLLTAVTTGTRPELVAAVRRIECAFDAMHATGCRFDVAVAIDVGRERVVGRLSRNFAWEYLPREVRREFARNANAAQRFLILDERITLDRKEPGTP